MAEERRSRLGENQQNLGQARLPVARTLWQNIGLNNWVILRITVAARSPLKVGALSGWAEGVGFNVKNRGGLVYREQRQQFGQEDVHGIRFLDKNSWTGQRQIGLRLALITTTREEHG